MKLSLTPMLLCLFFHLAVFGQGDTLYQTTKHDGIDRSYILYVPEDYDGSEAWPLVLNLHGFGITAEMQMTLSDMNVVADTGRFLVVYPQGSHINTIIPGLAPGGPGFTIGVPGDETVYYSPNGVDDVGFISHLIDLINGNYNVDLSRVYACGWSNGGIMASVLACELTDRLAAVASVAGTFVRGRPCDPARPMPILQINGTIDPLSPYEATDPPGDLWAVEEYLAFWAGINSCSPDPTATMLPDLTTADTSTVELQVWQDCGEEVVHYKINEGGHSWPGGINLFPFLGNYNLDISASSEIWDFFRRQSHPEPAVPQVLERSFVHQDSIRSYLLYVPAAYDGSEAWPLVLNLHGYALNAEFQMNFSNMNAVADTAHFLVAYPQGTMFFSQVPGIPPQGLGWNVSGPGDTVFVSPGQVDDVDFLEQVIDHIGADFRVAPERVYSTGFSNGGMMSYVLACELPERIAAIEPVAGTIPESRLCAGDQANPKPVLHIHGTADGVVPYEDGDPFLHSVGEILQFWTTGNGCDEQPQIIAIADVTTADSTMVERYEWQNCEAEMLHYRVIGGGHQWPGGNNLLPFLGHFNLDFNASSEIWNFFNRNPRPDVPSRLSNLSAQRFRIYPNPSFGDITVEFDLIRPQTVQLRMFNMLGQPATGVIQRHLPAGSQRINWNWSDDRPAAGIYYLQIRMDGKQLTQPVVLRP